MKLNTQEREMLLDLADRTGLPIINMTGDVAYICNGRFQVVCTAGTYDLWKKGKSGRPKYVRPDVALTDALKWLNQ